MDNFQYTCSEQEDQLLHTVTLPLNHSSVPPRLLASLAYQKRPIPVKIDNLDFWHRGFAGELKALESSLARAELFQNFMTVRFRLKKKGERYKDDPPPRPKVNYRRLLLGWLFDPENEQGAAWRSWVESRFGLITRYHEIPVLDPDGEAYMNFRRKCNKAIYNTNELYAQLDLLYFFCQLELGMRFPEQAHLTLYRGCTDLPEYNIDGEQVKLFNNLSSLTSDPESALRFGSKIFEVSVPVYKIVCFDSLLPGTLVGEQEYMVLGGLYKVKQLRYF